MVDWHSPETIAANAVSFTFFLHTIAGLYIWEWLITLDFDISFLLGKRPFKWPLLTYFYGRYAMLFGIIGFIVATNVRTEINCQVLYTVLQVLGNTALGMATTNLAIRTMAIWAQNLYIVVPLVILLLGQFGIILRSVVNVKAMYVPGTGCATTEIDSTIFAAMYIYTMAMDLIVLVLTMYKLLKDSPGATGSGKRSPVVQLLFRDGLIFFIVAFVGNTIAVVFSLLKLNDVMALIADIPATTFATIVACRAVRRLNTYGSGPAVHIFSSSGPSAQPSNPMMVHQQTANGGVRIQMTTFTQQDGDYDVEANRRYLQSDDNSSDGSKVVKRKDSIDDDKHAAL